MTKVKTETKEEKEALDAIKPALTRSQVVARDELLRAKKECERLGVKVDIKFK